MAQNPSTALDRNDRRRRQKSESCIVLTIAGEVKAEMRNDRKPAAGIDHEWSKQERLRCQRGV